MIRFYLQPALLAYLIGSIPTGYWLGKIFRGIDIRKFGSGNLGATNVYRVLGWKFGLATLIIDVTKGYIPTEFSIPTLQQWVVNNDLPFGYRWWYEAPPIVSLCLIAGICCILGNTFSCFVRFRGGKGVATSAGVFLALLPFPTLAAVVVFFLVFVLTRYVSLGSLTAVVALVATTFWMSAPRPLCWTATAVAMLVIWTHRGNITRLCHGTEDRFVWKKQPA